MRVSYRCRVFTEQEVDKLFKRCQRVMKNKGFPVDDVTYNMNQRLKRMLGRACFAERNIELNSDFFFKWYKRSTFSRIYVTLHELCHIAADDIIKQENKGKPYPKHYYEGPHGGMFKFVLAKVLNGKKKKLT